MKEVSIVARDFNTEEKVVGYYCAGERMKYRGTHGAFWGGLWGLLDGSGFFWVPGIGPTVVAGPLINWVVPASEKAVRFGSLSAIGASLCSLGVPEDCVVDYHYIAICREVPLSRQWLTRCDK